MNSLLTSPVAIAAAVLTAGFFVTLGLIPLMIRLSQRFKIVDQPADRKIHKQAVPYLGGIAILGGLLTASGIFLSAMPNLHVLQYSKALTILGAATLAFLLGLLDDCSKIRARHKLAGQIIIAIGFAVIGFHFHALTIPGLGLMGLQFLEIPLTVFWIVAVVNAVNLIDGADGLAGSVSLTILTIMGLMAVYLFDVVVGLIALAGIGAAIAFLIFNWRPAKIYMGDAGSLGLGMLIATSLVSLGQNEAFSITLKKTPASEPFLYHVFLITAAVAYPVLEITLSVFRRSLRGKPIASADKGHIHHRLMYQGWTAPQVCYAAMFMSLIAGGAVVYSLMQYRGAAAWFLGISGLMLGLGLHFCGFLDMLRPSNLLGNRPHFLIANHFIAMQKLKLDLAETAGELHALIAQTCTEFGIQNMSVTIALPGDAGKKAEFHWQRPSDAGTKPLLPQRNELPPPEAGLDLEPFSDRAELGSGTLAEWTFEPSAFEEDIDVEYRVLMGDFMRQALDRAEHLYQALDRSQLKAAIRGDRPVSSTGLRHRSGREQAISTEPSA